MNASLIFIVGVGRSGTSLVQSMFAAHPKVSCLPETAFIRRMIYRGYLDSVYKKHGIGVVTQVLSSDKYFHRTGLNPTTVVPRATNQGGLLDAAVYRQMLASYTGKDYIWVSDKDPRAIEFLPLLKVVFPSVHVIHVFRDPRDVLASKKKAAWSKNGHVWKHIFANKVQFRLGHWLGTKLFGENYHEIRYESLLSNPDQMLSDLCRDVGLEYDKGMLCFAEAAKKLVSEEEMGWKKETLGPLLNNNSEKWRTDLSPREVMLSEVCCSQAMAMGNYGKDCRRHQLCLKDKLWIQIGRLLISLATWPFMQYRVLGVKRACKRML